MSMSNAQCAFSQSQEEESQMMTEVDLFISTKAVKVLNADTQVSDGVRVFPHSVKSLD